MKLKTFVKPSCGAREAREAGEAREAPCNAMNAKMTYYTEAYVEAVKKRHGMYRLKILDSGDFYILHLSTDENIDAYMKLLYAELDITLEEHVYTKHTLNNNDYQKILKVCSRMIPVEKRTLDDLNEDIDGIMNYILIKESYSTTPSYISAISNMGMVVGGIAKTNFEDLFKTSQYGLLGKTIGKDVKDNADSKETTDDSKDSKEIQGYDGKEWFSYNSATDEVFTVTSYCSTDVEDWTIDVTEENTYYIFYHTEYKLSILISKNTLPAHHNAYETYGKYVPEFAYMDTFVFNIAKSGKTNLEIAQSLFAKKFYETKEDLNVKIEAFKVLYNAQAKTSKGVKDSVTTMSIPSLIQFASSSNQWNMAGGVGEKIMFEKILAEKYVMDSNIQHRMKASDLYQQLCLSMGYHSSPAIHRRFQSYLLEAGLRKKRYADGYYYYGIYQTVQADMASRQNNITLEQYVQLRDDDIQTLFKH